MEAPTAHRNAPSEHSGVPVGFFFEKAMLWPFLQNARPPGSLRSPSVCAPSRLAARWCSGRLIGCAKRSTFRFASLTLRWAWEASLPPCCAPSRLAARWCSGRLIGCAKRSTSRFASLTLRWAGEASLPPAPLSPAPGNAETDRRQSPSAGKALFRSTPWISLPLCVSPGGLVLPAHAAPTGGKTCSIHSRRNTLAAPGLFLLSYRSFFFSYFS